MANTETATIALPDFGGINDIAGEARQRLAMMARDETKGENAIWYMVDWIAARAGQMIAQGSLVLGDWIDSRDSENIKAFRNQMLSDAGVSAALDKDASKKARDARKADMMRVGRAADLFIAFMSLSRRHGIGADYAKRRVPAAWYIDAEKHTLTNPRAMASFVSRADVVRFHCTDANDADSNGDMIAIRPSVASTMRAAYPAAQRAARADGNSGADVSDASVKASADVLASRLAKDGGSVSGEAADALESVYHQLVANDATWSLLVALRTAHENEARKAQAIANGEPA